MSREETELDSKALFGEEGESEEEIQSEEEREFNGEMETDRSKGHKHKCHLPSMIVNCDVDVSVENKNKIIYVSSGKLQYFTANAICYSGDNTIELEYCGCKTRCICGEVFIKGCLGFYKIVKSGIIFIPRKRLGEFHNDWFATDILCFKVKEKDFKIDVVFTYNKSEGDVHCCKKRRQS